MIDNNPFSGFINAWKDASSAALQFSLDRLADIANFLGLMDKPDTEGLQPEFTPPFTGGQCAGVVYDVTIREIRRRRSDPSIVDFDQTNVFRVRGAIGGVTVIQQNPPTTFFYQVILDAESIQFGTRPIIVGGASSGTIWDAEATILSVVRVDGQPDNCGDLPNPNPPFPPALGGAGSLNPDDGEDGELVYAGLPVLSVAGILAALRAIAEGIAAIGDVLNGIRQIGEAIKQISDLLREIFDGKKDDDRAKPKYRRYAVGEWYRLTTVDGFIPTTPITLGGIEAIPYKIQVVVESFPATSSRVLGVLAPSISIDTLPLFYLLLQEDDFGITAVKTIRTLNSSTSIPPFHRGIFWNFRLNPSINAKYRFFYQTEQIEEEVEVQE